MMRVTRMRILKFLPSILAASWMFLSCKHPATLIQSSKQAGVEVVELPFEISAELIAKGLETNDQALSRMSALLSGGVLDDIEVLAENRDRC